MTIPDDFLAFAFPDNILNGTVIDAGGRTLYTLTSEERNFRSDVTTITRPDASIVASIQWGSVIGLKRRSVVLPNATVPAKEYLAEGKASSLGGPGSQVFQDQEGNEYYWTNRECYEGKKKALVAHYKPSDANSTLGPRLWVHPEYCSPNVLDHLIITSLLVAKSRKKASPSPSRISSDAHPSRTSYVASSSQRHGATGGFVGVYDLGGSVPNDSGVHHGGSNAHGGGVVSDGGGGGGWGGDSGGGDGGGGGGDGGGGDGGGGGGGGGD
ncbi:hypothetical protein M407DRAFT_27136 [Tulasnella calospora MUT 4182]|uniref:DUF6593 domain-containing protein n=1 Tax=Tulasnella calospora MUT 4182 TaxID=1051891 RepID=A0A0C3QCZ8_9AGAM|nr:hypothetical protein M407DRAFT_27136 [Tulasnella calospora MUT 4182]